MDELVEVDFVIIYDITYPLFPSLNVTGAFPASPITQHQLYTEGGNNNLKEGFRGLSSTDAKLYSTSNR